MSPMMSARSITRALLAGAAALVVGTLAVPASADTIYDLNQISAGNIGSGIQGTVTLTQNGADEVDVVVTLTPGVLLINSGGPHTPFVFNLASSVSGATVAVTSVNTPSTFYALSGPQSATPYGSFTNGIGYHGSNGGVGHGSAGPLDFKVVDASGITITDFVRNSGGYFFAADVYGTGGNTGSVASNASVAVPGPTAGAGLPGLVAACGGLLLWTRRRRTNLA